MRSALKKAFIVTVLAGLSTTLIGEPVSKKESGVVDSALWPAKKVVQAVGKGTQVFGQSMREEILRMRDFFDVTLPGVAERHHLLIEFEPKFGDLLRREYVRFPLEARYGLAPRTELFGGITPVAPNPFDDGVDHRWGLGLAKLGLRQDISAKLLWFDKLNFGLEVLHPLGNPPIEHIDHYMHVRPTLTAARIVPGMKDTTLFLNLLYDRAVWAPGHADVDSAVVKRHMAELAPGLLYKPGQLGYFGQYALRHWDDPQGYRLEHIGKLGVVWDMPLKRSKQWGLPGKWQIELGLKVSAVEGEGADFGVHSRVKVKTDWFRRGRKAR